MSSPLEKKRFSMPITKTPFYSWKIVFKNGDRKLRLRWSDAENSFFELSRFNDGCCIRHTNNGKPMRDTRIPKGGFKYEVVVTDWFIFGDAFCVLATEVGDVILTGNTYRGETKTNRLKSLRTELYKDARTSKNVAHNDMVVRAFAKKLFGF